MLDVGMTEIVVIGGAAILLLGKRDMPLVFRLVGRGVGKVSGLIQGGRARMTELSQGGELLQLQNEIRSNLDDLRVIRAELRATAQFPSGITGTSHPGSTALKDTSTLPQPSSSVDHLGAGRGESSTTTKMSVGVPNASEAAAAETSWNASGRRVYGVESVGVGSALAGGGVTGVLEGRAASMAGGSPAEAEVKARAGTGPRARMNSVASPGSDRLQRLAMAEVEFAEKELYAPKTELAPGGADILNDTIIESLLQERYRTVLQGSRSPHVGTKDKVDQD